MNWSKIKKSLSALLSMCMLMSCVMSVGAGQYREMASCRHPKYSVEKNQIGKEYDSENHILKYHCIVTCLVCGEKMDEFYSQEKEPHSMIYEDLGHAGNLHNYRLKCTGCSFSKDIQMACPGGPHNSPWQVVTPTMKQ